MIVTLPFFINYSFNTTYMEGDKPVLGVNAYGNGLKEGDQVMFEVSYAAHPDKKLTVAGKAFERVNIPLWPMEEGKHDLIIRAYTDSGLSDAVKHTINVVKSYYQIEKAEYYDLVPNINIPGGTFGNTRIVFQDKSKGMFLSDLINLYYSSGNRIDQKVAKYASGDLVLKYFPDQIFVQSMEKPSLAEYQKVDGGLSLLPYSSSDIDISAKLAVFARDMVETQKLKSYFYKILDTNNLDTKIKALYGLAALKEPVLLDLDRAAELDNISLTDTIYLALSYCELGELTKAEQVYDERIRMYIEEFTPYFRVNTGVNKDDILEATSLCSYLASKLDRPEKTGLYQYCTRNYATDILLSTEKLLFISNEIGKKSSETASFTYSFNGEEKIVTLENGRPHCITLLSNQLSNFVITSVQGDISVVSIFKEDVLDI